ncbi:MAG: PIN domain-containing protein [Nanoarchaeota archaeon]
MIVILDTTALIDLLRGEPDIIGRIKELEKRNIPLSTTTVSVFEIWQGVGSLTHEKKRLKIRLLLESLATYSFDIPAAKEAGTIHAYLKESGKVIDPEDSLIAGIAKIHRETILTRNTTHFRRIEELKIESY